MPSKGISRGLEADIIGLQPPLPLVLADLEYRSPILRLDPLPKATPTQLPCKLILTPEPLLGTPDPVRVDLIEQPIISLDHAVFPEIPEAGEVVLYVHRALVFAVVVVTGGRVGDDAEWTVSPVRVQVGVDVPRRMPGDLLERRGEIGVGDIVDSDLEVHAVRPLGMVEKPTHVVTAVL